MIREKLDKEILKEIYKSYNCNHGDRIANILGMYRIGEYIYPDVIQRNMRLTDKSIVFDILDKLVEAGLAEKMFQYHCPACGRPEGAFLKEDITDEVYCDSCDTELNKSIKHYIYKCL